jgi:hypothetical protein
MEWQQKLQAPTSKLQIFTGHRKFFGAWSLEFGALGHAALAIPMVFGP